jgi:iduronate 2-sulfatase
VPRSQHAGRATAGIVELVDLYPTLVDLCRHPAPLGLEGRSVTPLLNSPETHWEKPAYTMTIHEGVIGRSVRTPRWRYTEWEGRGAELSDHETDPGEYRNVVGEMKFACETAELKRLLRKPPHYSGPVPFDAQSPRTPVAKSGKMR